MRMSDWSSDVCSSDLSCLGNAPEALFATRRELTWNEAEPGGKVATAPKTLHWRGKSFDGQGGQWPNRGMVCKRRAVSASAASALIFAVRALMRPVFSAICSSQSLHYSSIN